jgi:hypothetical protein|tara:strand:+ start:284 stop:559 length:276 start_codon:yes stop_codon:yes gene_type:complete
MSETTTQSAQPQDGTVETPQAQPPALTVADLRNVRTIIDISSSRGAFRGAELKSIGEVYDKLDTFLKAIDAKAEEQKTEEGTAEATSKEEK